jgi:hypothetical protein
MIIGLFRSTFRFWPQSPAMLKIATLVPFVQVIYIKVSSTNDDQGGKFGYFYGWIREGTTKIYTVNLVPICDCPDYKFRHNKFCKHIKKVVNEWK